MKFRCPTKWIGAFPLLIALGLIVVTVNSEQASAQVLNVQTEVDRGDDPKIIARLQQLAWENHESNRVAETLVVQSNYGVRNARLEWLDAFTFTYNFYPEQLQDQAGPDLFNRAGIAFNINLGRLARTPGRIRMAIAERDLYRYELEVQRKRIFNDVIDRYSFFLLSAELYQLFLEAVENSQSTVNLVRERFEAGDLNIEQLQRGEEYLILDRQRLITARTDFFKARFAVEELIGVPIASVFEDVFGDDFADDADGEEHDDDEGEGNNETELLPSQESEEPADVNDENDTDAEE
ncbi:Outer membrane efflux protein [Cyclonatronum proteinivorum]|uniref:Outer membrane efflux protein n=1 Tax=Cyclonatronum proteinivorum TaxID=1457365 RepID=A0A345UIK4_9BACT|nr:TolC family protein [Cyclonatronum proteinivorum]AXJ00306.1 Outer membrane efflux protein [Cyclonatronum proteinivorum]